MTITEVATGVEMRDHVLIEMSDGVRLSARIWLPKTDQPVPALLEYLPYRKGDVTAPRDAQRHPWYAAHGYASVRVDMRGSGDSEGVMHDEYTEQELRDAVEVIEWLADQPWCDGSVGMFGISWGGFNSLQVAALAPEPLKAIVTVCSTDDRYADDVHYFGGGVLGVDMLGWATTMLAYTARPPDPARLGERWKDLWTQRLNALEPYLDTWLSHQERDDYWRHGSVCEDYGAIKAAVLAVGGWADPYRNAVFRLVENLPCPVKGIIGPWCHQYPDIQREPGPAIGFLQETLRWWDHWLKGVPTGVTEEPAVRAWMQDSVRPATRYATRPGRWVTEPSWPSPNVSELRTPLRAMLSRDAVGTDPVPVATPQHCGIDAGRYFPYGNPADLPPDQREEDGRSVCFDTAPLDEHVAILGFPAATLRVRASGPANVIVRLCDVAPDGSSTLVARGCLDLRRRAGMDRTVDLDPDETIDVNVAMTAIAWEFPPGHRIRLSVSTSYWPWVWPYPVAADVELHVDGSELVLPVRAVDAPSAPVHFEPPEQAPPMAVVFHGTDGPEREVRYTPQTGEWQLSVDPNYGGSRSYPDGLEFNERVRETYSIRSSDPSSASCGSDWAIQLRRPGWDVRIAVSARMAVDDGDFVTTHQLTTTLNDEPVCQRAWNRRIPRPGSLPA
ncbi:MAG: peptidase [Dactylosporangium sp.]|jgi:putative CocE/NonD family hydrolase|nr:peptidase [Dactylosporangium sp.]